LMLQAGGQWCTVARRAAYVLLQQGALSFSCSLPSTVPVLYRSQCCAVCRCAVQRKSTSSATCVDNGGEGADCSQRGGLLAKVSAAPLCQRGLTLPPGAGLLCTSAASRAPLPNGGRCCCPHSLLRAGRLRSRLVSCQSKTQTRMCAAGWSRACSSESLLR